MNKKDYYWYWLNNIPGIGRITCHKLLDLFGSPEKIYHADEEEVMRLLRQSRQRENFAASKDRKQIVSHYQKLAEKGISFVHPESNEYPERLRNIPDAPLGLYVKGNFPPEKEKAVAIIGTRQCTRYGSEMARFFGRELAKCGVSIISGLARGIDGMAHSGALEAEGYTMGVLGCGIDIVYPRENYRLFMQMEAKGGILSESNIGIQPSAGLFPERNRLIAGLADGVLVVEAREKSGTFITVDQGLEQGKEILAIPGRITDAQSMGCNNLVKLGAHMVTDVEDVLEVLRLTDKPHGKRLKCVVEENFAKNALAPIEKMVYSCLRVDEAKYVDDIVREVGIAPQQVCMALNHLVILNIIEETARNYYAVRV